MRLENDPLRSDFKSGAAIGFGIGSLYGVAKSIREIRIIGHFSYGDGEVSRDILSVHFESMKDDLQDNT